MSGGLCNSPAEAQMAFLLLSSLSSLPSAGRTWLDFTIKIWRWEKLGFGEVYGYPSSGPRHSFDRWGDGGSGSGVSDQRVRWRKSSRAVVLKQGLVGWEGFAPRGHLPVSGDIFWLVVTTRGIWWVEAGDAAHHLMVHRRALTKNCLTSESQ